MGAIWQYRLYASLAVLFLLLVLLCCIVLPAVDPTMPSDVFSKAKQEQQAGEKADVMEQIKYAEKQNEILFDPNSANDEGKKSAKGKKGKGKK